MQSYNQNIKWHRVYFKSLVRVTTHKISTAPQTSGGSYVEISSPVQSSFTIRPVSVALEDTPNVWRPGPFWNRNISTYRELNLGRTYWDSSEQFTARYQHYGFSVPSVT